MAKKLSLLPLLVIDGYSVIYCWNDLRLAKRQSLRKARELLIEKLILLHDLDIYQVVVVFDGNNPEPVSIPKVPEDFTIVFSPKGSTADGVIEKFVSDSVAQRTVTVITADLEEKRQVESLGAFCMSPEWLMQEIEYRKADFKDVIEKVHLQSRF
ncbi:NYN domain-containing protein [Methylacidiphilum caldifontis]|uniref:Pilus assembly protein CpaF n=1 Tax=Methylacidiphilum caldifontis TaxID=2795386 RepID=A0A4Y8PGQ2_9BACT|nr:NYN domain-containing protein [Methylacidiphilum caldifontis]QSR88474.1 NYN domain-containing protein [Methylacidiphilum caldifontis]TFE71302.1 pilus assembly protein CpaF [Methylacidiphilum caldifontis]